MRSFEPRVGDAGARSSGGCVVQHGVALWLGWRGGIVGDHLALIPITQARSRLPTPREGW